MTTPQRLARHQRITLARYRRRHTLQLIPAEREVIFSNGNEFHDRTIISRRDVPLHSVIPS